MSHEPSDVERVAAERGWEIFVDDSYYHMICIRKIGERRFGAGFHFASMSEAIEILEGLPITQEPPR
jgi:hypothetical protein